MRTPTTRRARRRTTAAVGALLALALVAAACGDDDDDEGASSATTSPPAAAPATTDAEAAPATTAGDDEAAPTTEAAAETTSAPEDTAPEVDRDAEYTFGASFGWNSFDPHTTPAPGSDALFLSPVYDQLVTLGNDEDGAVILEPQLAESWEIADDGLTITFELRDDVTFQDGEPFNAEAVKANIDRVKSEGSSVASLLASVESVEVTDEYTAVFHLSRSDPSVPWALATDTTGYMVSPAAFDNPDLSVNPVGTGPFKLVSAVKDSEVVYERWDDHWDPDAALVKKLTMNIVFDQNARYNGIQTGQFDTVYLATPLDFQAKSLEDEGYHWDLWLAPTSVGLLVNTDMAPFDDVRTRQALSMAIDRTSISESLFNGINPPVYQPFVEGIDGHNPAVDSDPYDPGKARALIEEAGLTGASIEILSSTSEPTASIALITQQALTDIGFNVEVLPMSPSEGRSLWREGGKQAYAGPITSRFTPSQTIAYSWISGPDNPGTPDPTLVEMNDAALALPPNSDEQVKAYEEISAYLVENPVHVPYVQFSTVFLSVPEVVGSESLASATIADLNFRGIGKTAS